MKRLYRSDKEKMLSGVCGGLAIYFNVDPTLIRLLWVLLFFMNPLMIIVYIIAAIIIPIAPEGVLYDFSKEPEKIKAKSGE
ncbi:phage shock protein C [Methanococcus maripaludis]|uniref:Phage shock protein C n=1 Tax=Methanococcus maripaludis TaxID=39152 RepID=A0A7J9NRC3_METMI|nr:PspC domain-containing protein [Methanococcus maripaludis]MBA2850220.1 phage shock protein C [Methanococcus maripaludis]